MAGQQVATTGTRRRVAVAQMTCVALDPAANAEATVAQIERAADDGADLVVLPELAGPGYVLTPAVVETAERVDDPGPCLRAWTSVARRRRVAVVAGFAEVDGGRLFNSAAVIDRSGAVAAVYRKLHLFGEERAIFAPGDHGLVLADVDGITVGVLVCYDLRFPEALRILALRGAELIAVPTAWVPGFDRLAKQPVPGQQIGQVDGAIVQANLSQVYVACAGMTGTTLGRTFLGSSVVVDPYGRALAGPLGHNEIRTAVVDIDLDDVRQARHRGPGINPFTDRRTDVYGELLGHIAPESNPLERPIQRAGVPT